MVPIYSLSSLIALYSIETAFLIDLIRDLYEAFCICKGTFHISSTSASLTLLYIFHFKTASSHCSLRTSAESEA